MVSDFKVSENHNLNYAIERDYCFVFYSIFISWSTGLKFTRKAAKIHLGRLPSIGRHTGAKIWFSPKSQHLRAEKTENTFDIYASRYPDHQFFCWKIKCRSKKVVYNENQQKLGCTPTFWILIWFFCSNHRFKCFDSHFCSTATSIGSNSVTHRHPSMCSKFRDLALLPPNPFQNQLFKFGQHIR